MYIIYTHLYISNLGNMIYMVIMQALLYVNKNTNKNKQRLVSTCYVFCTIRGRGSSVHLNVALPTHDACNGIRGVLPKSKTRWRVIANKHLVWFVTTLQLTNYLLYKPH